MSVSSATSVERGCNPSYIDFKADKTQSFYDWANGSWVKSHEGKIPDGYSRWSTFNMLAKRVTNQLVDRLEGLNPRDLSHTESLVYSMYRSAQNQEARDAAGIKPLEDVLNEIEKIETLEDVIDTLVFLYHEQVFPFFGQMTDAHPERPEVLTAIIDEGGIHLPNHANYSDSGKCARLKEYVQQMMLLGGCSERDASSAADVVVKIESALAQAFMSDTDKLDPTKTNHVRSPNAISDNAATSALFARYFKGLGIAIDEIVITNPAFIDRVGEILTTTRIESLKAYLRFNVIDSFSEFLSEEFVKCNFAFYQTYLRGVDKPKAKNETCVDIVSLVLKEPMSRVWVDGYYPPEKKQKLKEMGELISTVFIERVSKLEWMVPETKEKAIAKAKDLLIEVAYPDDEYWRDYSGLKGISEHEILVTNIRQARRYNTQAELDKVGSKTERKHWLDTPYPPNFYWFLTAEEPNNFNKFSKNAVYSCGGLMQGPVFCDDIAASFGAAGAIIGHEAFHSVDPTGRHYSPDRKLEDWWTSEDALRFREQQEKMIKQFDQYHVTFSDGTTAQVDGALTCRENMSDHGGLLIAFEAMQRYFEGKKVEVIDGFTSEQRFFIAFAQTKKNVITDQALTIQVKTNEHAPSRVRVDGNLAQNRDFQRAFDIPNGTPMVVAEKFRCTIWDVPE